MSDRDKVFLVTDGAYSDYHIVAAFSSRESAETYVAEKNKRAMVEEYELDQPLDDLPGAHEVRIDGRGEVVESRWCSYYKPTKDPESLKGVFIGWGRTEEHARRSAEQLRRETIAAYGSAGV